MSVVGGLENQRQGGHGDREDAVRNVVGVLEPADVPQVLQNIVHAGPRIGVGSTPPDQPTRPLEGHGVSIGSLGHGRGVQPPEKKFEPSTFGRFASCHYVHQAILPNNCRLFGRFASCHYVHQAVLHNNCRLFQRALAFKQLLLLCLYGYICVYMYICIPINDHYNQFLFINLF